MAEVATMQKSEAVAIIDDDDSIRSALTRLLTTAGIQALAFPSAAEFFDHTENRLISCVILDLCMPDIDGLRLQNILSQCIPHVGIIFVTGHADVASSVIAMKSGAVDFLEKPVKRIKLLDAVERAIERTHSAATRAAELYGLKDRYARLTHRESEILALVSAGLLNKQIAAECGVSIKTVKQHRSVVMKKMYAYSLADLVVMADRLGVRPSDTDFSKAKGLSHSS